jgi:hypothetical protein
VEQIKKIQQDARVHGNSHAAALADDRPQFTQGLDGAEDGRWPAD